MNKIEKIRNILLEFWDPIGVFGDVDAEDEYDNYLPTVLRLLENGTSETEISKALVGFEESMGIDADNENAIRCAKLLCQLVVKN